MQSYGLLGFINDTQSVWECKMHIGSCQEVVYSLACVVEYGMAV